MMLKFAATLQLATLLGAGAAAASAAQQFYVDPLHGSDTNSGKSPSSAFATIPHAALAAAATKAAATVHLAAAVYRQPVSLGPPHSGRAGAVITFRGPSGGGAVLSGGLAVPNSSFKASGGSGGGGVFVADLAKLGVNLSDLGSLAPSALGGCAGDKVELVESGVVLDLARWPNKNASKHSPAGYPGFNNWANIRQVWGSGGGSPQAFSLSRSNTSCAHPPYCCPGRPNALCPTFGPVPSAKQLQAWAKEEDLWLHGYWSNDWGDSYVTPSKISADRIDIDQATPPCYPVLNHARVMVVNALSELDSPGEYYISKAGKLSLIPSSKTGALAPDGSYALTMRGSSECVLCLDSASYITFENIGAGFSRGTPVGCKDCESVSFVNVSVSATGGVGIAVSGSNNLVENCTIRGSGCRGMTVSGGDAKTLKPANNMVVGNLIEDFARIHRTYNPGISWSGVGSVFSQNTVRRGPHAAILGSGLNTLFEHNTIENMAYEVDDAGAFYTGRSWVERGNVLQHNTFRSIRTRVPVFLGAPSVQAIYLDDQMSGYTVQFNTFEDCQVGMFIGGGRRNAVVGNMFRGCDTALHIDNRGSGCYNISCFPNCPGNCDASTIWDKVGLNNSKNGKLLALGPVRKQYTSGPWAARFPELGELLTVGTLGDPILNVIASNSACGCGAFLPKQYNASVIEKRYLGVVTNNTVKAKC